MEQKMFSEDESTGVQRETLRVREGKAEDDLDDDVLAGSVARVRYLLIAAVFEPSDGNVREGDGAKEV
jgi:hypothetical protein